MTSRVPALVVGAGISGLVCAYALRKRGIEPLVLEATARPGGVIRSERRDGFLVELGPQSFSGTSALRRLCQELGIHGELVEAPPKAPRYVVADGKLRAVPLNPVALMTTSLLTLGTRWSIARDALGKSQAPLQDESIADFMRRKFSSELLDRFVGPFVSGIYAGDPERLSVRSAFPSVYEAEKSAGSMLRGMIRARKAHRGPRERPTLFGFREGNETLIRVLADKLAPSLRCGAEVTGVERESGGIGDFRVFFKAAGQEECVSAERLIVASPAYVAGKLLGNVSPEAAGLLSGIEYAPVAIASLGYRREHVRQALDGFGFLVPRSAGLRLLGTVWNSSLFADRAPKGFVLLTSFLGGATDPQAASLAEDNLTALVHRELALLLGITDKPVFVSTHIYRRALPQYNIGHAQRLAAIENALVQLPGWRLAGNYLRGPAIGACVEQALAVAGAI